jgi:hypothetical protein
LALKLKTPYAIYQYVVDNLTYDFTRAQDNKSRIGAYDTLKNPKSAVCLEFTDLFIAIARAANIPTREINGFASTSNSRERPLSLVKDILHAWPEYYDYNLQTWTMVDPTWSNTTGGVDYFHTLDFDHFVFVIRGIDSAYPVPAGGYKLSDNNTTKDIDVKFGTDFPEQLQNLTLSSDFSSIYFSGLNFQGNIFIKNDGQIMSTPQEVKITATFLNPKSQRIFIGPIPPFGFLKVPVNFEKTSLLTNKTETIKITVGEKILIKDIKISLFVLNKWTILGGTILVSIIFTISYVIYKTRNLYLSRQGK